MKEMLLKNKKRLIICSIVVCVIGLLIFGVSFTTSSKAFQSPPKYLDPAVSSERANNINDVKIIRIQNINDGNGTIYYTLNGEDPTNESQVYYNTFSINEDCTLKCIIIDEEGEKSNIVTTSYTVERKAPAGNTAADSKAVNDKGVNTVTTLYSPQLKDSSVDNKNKTNSILKKLTESTWKNQNNSFISEYTFEQTSENEGTVHWLLNGVNPSGLSNYLDGTFVAEMIPDANGTTRLVLHFKEITQFRNKFGDMMTVTMNNDGTVKIDGMQFIPIKNNSDNKK